MELNHALALVTAWARDSKDMTLIGNIVVDGRGGFVTKSAGAFFRYDAASKELVVSGLVSSNIHLHSKHPQTWDKVVRASKREWATLGEGNLELYTKEFFSFAPDVILLTKAFKDDAINPRQFVLETDWLLTAAHYWLIKRYSEVLGSPEQELAAQGPVINERMLKERPRPW